MATREQLDSISGAIISAAIAVHKELGAGLLESAYEACLEYELRERGFDVKRQLELPVNYRGVKVDAGFRIDLLVNGLVIVELKAVERLEKIHETQTQTYLKLTGLHLGVLMNFNVLRLTDGLRRIVRDFPD
jgi:GxxExxY protein